MGERRTKLVRDLIPTLARANGGEVEETTLADARFAAALADKLVEEAMEFRESLGDGDTGDPRELADVEEVLRTLVRLVSSPRQVRRIRRRKARERGGFKRRILMTWEP